MAEEGGGMTVSKLVVIIMALLLLVLIAVGAYNGWLVNGIQKMGSQMDKILIFFNQKGKTTEEGLCFERSVNEKEFQGHLEICPSECRLNLNNKIGPSSKFKINTTGIYRFLENTDYTQSQGENSNAPEGKWEAITKTNSEEIKEEIETNENFEILKKILEDFSKEINSETTEELPETCNSNKDCPTGYFCDGGKIIDPSYCQLYQIESLENGKRLIKKIEGSTENKLFYLDSKGKVSFFYYEDESIGIINSEGKITFNQNKYPLECKEYIKKDKTLCDVLKNDEYLRLESCSFKEQDLEYFNSLKEKHSKEIENLDEYIPKYNLLIQKLKESKNLKNSNEAIYNQILNTEPTYYVYIDKDKEGILYKNIGDKWYFKTKINTFYEVEERLLDKSHPPHIVDIARISGGYALSRSSNEVSSGPLTEDNKLTIINQNYGVVYLRKINEGKDNTEGFIKNLGININKNKEETEKIKKDFEDFYKEDLENKFGTFPLIDGRIIFTLDDKYGITKKVDIDILDVTNKYLDFYIKNENNWEKIESESIVELEQKLNNLNEIQEEKIAYKRCEKLEERSILNKIFFKNDVYYIFISDFKMKRSGESTSGKLIIKNGNEWFLKQTFSGDTGTTITNFKEYIRLFGLNTGIKNPFKKIKTLQEAVNEIKEFSKEEDGKRVYHGQITENFISDTERLSYDFGLIDSDNIEEFYQYLASNLTQNQDETEHIKQLFRDYLFKQEKEIELFDYGDGRMMLSIDKKYGISKNKDGDVLEIDYPDLKMFEFKDGSWEEINSAVKVYFTTVSVEIKKDTSTVIEYLNKVC